VRLPAPHLPADDARVRAGLARLRVELDVPGPFPDEALAEAERAAAAIAAAPAGRVDRTDVELVTIDPPGSTDLDQALSVRRDGTGFRVHYAIADLAAFVAPGGPLDAEGHRRGVTHYAPDGRAPLHPDRIGTDAASLLPDGARPALLWTIDLDGDGLPTSTVLERATVRSRAQLDYAQAQRWIDGAAGPPAALEALADVGRLRREQEEARGGISLTHPQQEVERVDGGFRLRYAAPLPVEGHNAQISLLCGIEAARIMLDGGIGLLRTMPPPDPRDLERLRRVAGALGVRWDAGASYPAFVRSLDPATAIGGALLTQCARTLRGAAYTAFDGAAPDDPATGRSRRPTPMSPPRSGGSSTGSPTR